MNAINLKGRHAIVTGAAQGIGLAITMRLLASGASVSLWDRDQELLSEVRGSLNADDRIAIEAVDVTHSGQLEAAANHAVATFGKIDILIANAGIAGPNHPTWEYPIDDWKKVIDINLIGVFLSCRAVLPYMLRNGYGRIVNVASIAGKEGNANASAYSASKAGVIAFTKSLGKETAEQNIAVNCITPAAAKTKIFDQMTQQHIDFMLSRIPRKRFLELEEVAAMTAWLVSEENSFTTGAVFDLSGGRPPTDADRCEERSGKPRPGFPYEPAEKFSWDAANENSIGANGVPNPLRGSCIIVSTRLSLAIDRAEKFRRSLRETI